MLEENVRKPRAPYWSNATAELEVGLILIKRYSKTIEHYSKTIEDSSKTIEDWNSWANLANFDRESFVEIQGR